MARRVDFLNRANNRYQPGTNVGGSPANQPVEGDRDTELFLMPGIEFFLIYPATFKIKSKAGVMESFQCPRKAEEYLKLLLRGPPRAEDGDVDN
ncbi:unnamed protein product%2C partial [Xyrichtys novacula]|uniref:Unnamed protein product, partial n=1 Tax=Xyrichtys novacula TaxID=13765 RepID=A0AAV1HNH8_XYRNO|nr:unnamed protein product%2C partial [Xyrichtys novacula]